MKRMVILFALVLCGILQLRAQDNRAALANLPDLVGPLKATPGCLGVETAQTSSGKRVIFAWFEDRKALMRWYSSDLHQQLMKMAPTPNHPPLQDIPEGTGPILTIASMTPAPPANASALPFSQRSEEHT